MPDIAMAYLDESGDWGWRHSHPYGAGGSSRYFVIAVALGLNNAFRRFGNVVDKLHKAQNWTSKHEKKWATISPKAKTSFCQIAAAELYNNKDLHVMAAVCKKDVCGDFMRSVDVRSQYPHKPETELQVLEAQYRGRGHLSYSMMTAELLSEHMPHVDVLSYCPDALNEGVRTLDHLLAYKLLYQDARPTELRWVQYQPPMQGGLDFADLVAGVVWDHFENGVNDWIDVLRPCIKIKTMPPHWEFT